MSKMTNRKCLRYGELTQAGDDDFHKLDEKNHQLAVIWRCRNRNYIFIWENKEKIKSGLRKNTVFFNKK